VAAAHRRERLALFFDPAVAGRTTRVDVVDASLDHDLVQMLQDAGLSLDDIAGILGADDNAAWKTIATERLTRLDDEIARLQHARELLAAALMCRFDHPIDECRIMNDEIDTA
jgi:DNA-binding transcriptional MerR regulator